MVVDDEEFCLASMKAILMKSGVNVDYQVDFCINGKEAYEHIKKAYLNQMSYKVIFTDFNMPVMDGLESITNIRRFLKKDMHLDRSKQPWIIGVTGNANNDFSDEINKVGIDMVY